MKKLKVKSISSNGIAIGKACIIKKVLFEANAIKACVCNKEEEISRFGKAVEQAHVQISDLLKTSEIFRGHLMLINDITLKMSVIDKIEEGMNAEQALIETITEYEHIFKSSEDTYLRERYSDVKDIGNLILQVMKGDVSNSFADISEATIIIADELTPSDMPKIRANKNIKGIVTQDGGATSHVSILAKIYGIPAFIGAQDLLGHVNSEDLIILDATEGNIIINPDHEVYMEYMSKSEAWVMEQSPVDAKSLKVLTADGEEILLYINAGDIDEVKLAYEYGTEGVGLYRSEILFMQFNDFPSEEDQYKAYREISEASIGVVNIRALDIGGDKELPYYRTNWEANPSLGWRGIRVLLDNEKIFKTQLRAILRGNSNGNIRLLLPMITSIDELIKVRAILELCNKELRNENIEFNEKLDLGIMVETPAVVINIDNLAFHADFLSIGTNDLTQYILAVDRANNKVAHLYNSFHPAVLSCINMVVEAGIKHNKRVGICGEMAGDYRASKLLIGLGLKELSMAPCNISNVRKAIINTELKEAKQLAQKALSASSIEEVMKLLSI